MRSYAAFKIWHPSISPESVSQRLQIPAHSSLSEGTVVDSALPATVGNHWFRASQSEAAIDDLLKLFMDREAALLTLIAAGAQVTLTCYLHPDSSLNLFSDVQARFLSRGRIAVQLNWLSDELSPTR